MLPRLRIRLGDLVTIKNLLEAAEAIARREGIERPAAEHLLLAAFDLPDGTASGALERVGSSAERFRSALREQHAEALAAVGVVVDEDLIDANLPEPRHPTGAYRSQTSSQELFRRAGGAARAEGGGLLGAHVIRAAAELEHGTIVRAFESMGVDADELRTAATAEITVARAHRR